MRERLGIDIGGVISQFKNEGRKNGEFLKSPPVKNATQVIAELVEYRFGPEVYLVSKCGYAMQRDTRLWLAAQHFYDRAGIAPDHVWFCLSRGEKADIAKVLELTHFIDDRLEILSYLDMVPNKILFRPNPREVASFATALPTVSRVETWDEVRTLWVP